MTTDYTNIETYRCEKDPESMRRDVLDCLDAGVATNDIDACLMRNNWIEGGYQLLHRLNLREQEKRELAAFRMPY